MSSQLSISPDLVDSLMRTAINDGDHFFALRLLENDMRPGVQLGGALMRLAIRQHNIEFVSELFFAGVRIPNLMRLAMHGDNVQLAVGLHYFGVKLPQLSPENLSSDDYTAYILFIAEVEEIVLDIKFHLSQSIYQVFNPDFYKTLTGLISIETSTLEPDASQREVHRISAS